MNKITGIITDYGEGGYYYRIGSPFRYSDKNSPVVASIDKAYKDEKNGLVIYYQIHDSKGNRIADIHQFAEIQYEIKREEPEND